MADKENNNAGASDAPKRILIIEDDAVVARLYQNRLQKDGYVVEIAVEGQEGFFQILKNKPDGVLLDLMLPNMDGVQILKKTRAQKTFQNLPIIAFSNAYMNGQLDEALAAGATRVFYKSDPATPQNIIAGFREVFFPFRAAAEAAASGNTLLLSKNGGAPAPENQQPAAVQNGAAASGHTGFITRVNTSAVPGGTGFVARSNTPAPAGSTGYFVKSGIALPDMTAPAPAAPVAEARVSPAPARSFGPIPRMGVIPTNRPAAPATPAVPRAETVQFPTAPSPATEPPMRAEDPTIQEEFRKLFFDGGPETMSGLRKSLRAYSKEPGTPAGLAQLNGFYRRMHSLTGSAGMAGQEAVGAFSSSIEVLLLELLRGQAALQPSTLRTLANAVDLLGLLFDLGPAFMSPLPTEPAVLVVDDDVISRRAVMFGLEKAKIKSTGLGEPLAALELLAEKQFELVFLDVDMPEMDGFEVCSRLRQFPGYKAVPVVFITSLTDFQSRAKSITSGGNDFISKPVLFMELAVKAITFILRGRLNLKSSSPVQPAVAAIAA